jgi:hypothetical protein
MPYQPNQSILNTPGMAMAMAAGQNLGNPLAPQLNPMQEYQQAVQLQAQMHNRNRLLEQQEAQEKRAAEQHQREMAMQPNPYGNLPNDIQEWKLSGFEGPFEEFMEQQRLLRSTDPVTLQVNRALNAAKEAGDEGQYNQIYNIHRAQQPVTIGDATLRHNPYRGTWQTVGENGEVVDFKSVNDYISSMEADRAAEKATSTAWANDNQKFGAEFGTRMGEYSTALNGMRRTLEVITNPEAYDSQGPLAGLVSRFYDPDAAAINAAGVRQTIETLANVTTGALSEKELALFASIAANVSNRPEVNARLMEEAIRLTEERMQKLADKGRYYRDHGGSLEGYGFEKWLGKPEQQVVTPPPTPTQGPVLAPPGGEYQPQPQDEADPMAPYTRFIMDRTAGG